jgi:hypothetical protein
MLPSKVLIVADFCHCDDRAFRLASEIRFFHGRGLSVGLMQSRRPVAGDRIFPDIMAAVRGGMAHIVLPDDDAAAGIVLVHQPSRCTTDALPVLGTKGAEIAVVSHTVDDLRADLPRFAARARVAHYVTDPELREKAHWTRRPSRSTWVPPVPPRLDHRSDRAAVMSRQAMAWIGQPVDTRFWEGASEQFVIACPPNATAGLRDISHLSLSRILAGIGLFVVSDKPHAAPPDTLVAAALAAGRTVLAPIEMSHRYGQGPQYFRRGRSEQALRAAHAAAREARDTPTHLKRCANAPIAKLAAKLPSRPVLLGRDNRPALFLPSNGVGVGHLTRLLAIARRYERRAVFATQAPAVGLINDFGYEASYIPSATMVGGNFDDWDSWFQTHITDAVDRHDPAVVVYDGNHPSWGLINAVASRGDCRLVWVRRGMWARTSSDFLDNARWCDLVIEPGELAEGRDSGVTANRRTEARPVNPIRLLDPEELNDRTTAAAAVGLDPAKPAVLVQLGSGHNRDLLSVLDTVIGHLRAIPDLQIAITEWVNGTMPLNLWPDVTVLRGFPISQHIRAFDFCISAAGYNSFHELMSYGIATIFLANKHPSMDDQYGRAKFAQDMAAAFEISEEELHELPELLQLLVHGQARAYLAAHASDIQRANGAAEAAAALSELVPTGGGQSEVAA